MKQKENIPGIHCSLGHCRMVHDTDIVELELRSKRFSLAVRKKEAIEAVEPQVIYQVRGQPAQPLQKM